MECIHNDVEEIEHRYDSTGDIEVIVQCRKCGKKILQKYAFIEEKELN